MEEGALRGLFPFAIYHLPFSILLLLLFGCHPKNPPTPKGHFGPTEPMDDVVATINQNNTKLPTLWADIRDIRIQFTDDNNKRQDEKLDGGVLLYRQQPRSLRLNGDKLVLGNVMQLGSNEEVYWLAHQGRPGHRLVGAPPKCRQGVQPADPDPAGDADGGARHHHVRHELRRAARAGDALQQRPGRLHVHLGRAARAIALSRRARSGTTAGPSSPSSSSSTATRGASSFARICTGHKPVEVENAPREQWPSVATEYDLFFPETGAKLNLRLGQVKLKNKGAPSQATFNFSPDARRLGVSKVIQLDEACGP